MLDLNETISNLLGLWEDALKLNFKKCRSFLRQNDIWFTIEVAFSQYIIERMHCEKCRVNL